MLFGLVPDQRQACGFTPSGHDFAIAPSAFPRAIDACFAASLVARYSAYFSLSFFMGGLVFSIQAHNQDLFLFSLPSTPDLIKDFIHP